MKYRPVGLFCTGKSRRGNLPAPLRRLAGAARRVQGLLRRCAPPARAEVAAELSGDDYAELARRTARQLGRGSFFNGGASLEGKGFTGRLSMTLVVRRSGGICEVCPVWWEMNTRDASGREIPNDFDFSAFAFFLSSML